MTEPPRLLDRVRAAIRTRHYSRRTEDAYIGWIKRFIFFHGKRHPAAMGPEKVNAFLSHLAVRERVSASTQARGLCALLFLYRHPPERPGAGARRRLPSRRAAAEISECGARAHLAAHFSVDEALARARDGAQGRHHLDESVVQRAVREVVPLAGIGKPAACHTRGTHSRRISSRTATTSAPSKELLGHTDVRTTMIDTHVLQEMGKRAIRSPLDRVAQEEDE